MSENRGRYGYRVNKNSRFGYRARNQGPRPRGGNQGNSSQGWTNANLEQLAAETDARLNRALPTLQSTSPSVQAGDPNWKFSPTWAPMWEDLEKLLAIRDHPSNPQRGLNVGGYEALHRRHVMKMENKTVTLTPMAEQYLASVRERVAAKQAQSQTDSESPDKPAQANPAMDGGPGPIPNAPQNNSEVAQNPSGHANPALSKNRNFLAPATKDEASSLPQQIPVTPGGCKRSPNGQPAVPAPLFEAQGLQTASQALKSLPSPREHANGAPTDFKSSRAVPQTERAVNDSLWYANLVMRENPATHLQRHRENSR